MVNSGNLPDSVINDSEVIIWPVRDSRSPRKCLASTLRIMIQ